MSAWALKTEESVEWHPDIGNASHLNLFAEHIQETTVDENN